MTGLSDQTWVGLQQTYRDGKHATLYRTAFGNGFHFQETVLRRPADVVEWSGGQRQVFHTDLPVDLRADEVYLISCKYQSRILQNPSPVALFDGLLAQARSRAKCNWYQEVAAEQYLNFYVACTSHARAAQPGLDLPERPDELTKEQARALRVHLSPLPAILRPEYRELCREVSIRSAARWRAKIAESGLELHLFWRLLRISAAQYYVLGEDERSSPVRLKVISSADWRRRYRLMSFTVQPASAGQPRVNWVASVQDMSLPRARREIAGHVEIRWSHGKFVQPPEAKVYLDIPIRCAPGYMDLGANSLALP